MTTETHFQKPGWFTVNVFNRVVSGLTRCGISVAGSRVLEVPGRTSGEPRRTPVNLLTVDDQRYLVAPRGHTQWVRNLRAGGEGRLLLGRRSEPFTATEIPDGEKTPLLRAYRSGGSSRSASSPAVRAPTPPDVEFQRIAPDHPVFRISPC